MIEVLGARTACDRSRPGCGARESDRVIEMIAGALCLTGMALVYVFAVHTTAGQALDTAVMLAATRLADATWTAVILEFVGPFSLALGTVAIAAVGQKVHGKRVATQAVGIIAITVVGAQVLLAAAITLLVGYPRQDNALKHRMPRAITEARGIPR